MHGNAKKNLDDNSPFQLMVDFFLQICFMGEGGQENQQSLDFKWA